MKILPVNSYYGRYNQNFKKHTFAQKSSVSINNGGDVFTKQNSIKNFLATLFYPKKKSSQNLFKREFLNKKDKFQISDYKKMTPEQKAAIKEGRNLADYFSANINVNFARGIKEMLDKKYGKDGYVFVSIGTSPSLIGKVLEYMGVETKYLPISGLNKNFEEIFENNNFNKYGKFLSTQGIDRKTLEESKKKFIFYDYTYTGSTLQNFEKIMREKLDLPTDKIDFRSLNEDLEEIFLGQIYIDDTDAVLEYIENFLKKGGAETYSSIGHLEAKNIDAADFTPQALNGYDKKAARLFNFYVMDILNSKGELQENLLNKNLLW